TGTNELPHVGVIGQDGNNQVSIDPDATFQTLRAVLAGTTPLPHISPAHPVLPIRDALQTGRLNEVYPHLPENLAPDIARLELKSLAQKTAGILGEGGLDIVAQNLGT